MQPPDPSASSSPPIGALAQALLERSPRTVGELQSRFDEGDPGELALQLVDALRGGAIDTTRQPWLLDGLSMLDLQPHWEPLAALFTDPATPAATRALLQAVLVRMDAPRAVDLTEALPQPLMMELAAASIGAVFVEMERGDAAPDVLVDVLQELPPEAQVPMFEQLERLRAETSVPAAAAWGPVLRLRALRALHAPALAAVVEDGGREAEELLERLKARASGKKERRLYDKALSTIRAADASRLPAQGPSANRCFVSPCDGQGAFVAMLTSKGSFGRMGISDIVVRAAACPRDGFFIPDGEEDDLDELLEQLQLQFPMELAPPGEVATLVAQSLRRAKAQGVSLSKDTRMGLRAFEKLHRKTRVELTPLPIVPPVPTEQYEELLAGLPSWFLDSGDLAGQGVVDPGEEGPSPEWFEAAAAQLQGTPVQARLLAMTDYQARWFGWVGEPELAEVCAAAHAELAGDLAESGFLAAILDVSGELLGEGGLDLSRLGDPDSRSALRASYFPGVVRATGRDLARLDFTEATDVVLDHALKLLPGEQRPAADDQRALAHTLGCLWVDLQHGLPVEGEDEPDDFEVAAAAILGRELKLDADTADELAACVADDLDSFEEEFCSDCPVDCLSALKEDRTRVFHSDLYPPMSEPD